MCPNAKNHSTNDRVRGSWVSGSSACWGPVRQLFTSKQMRCHLLQVSVAIHSLAHRKKKGFLWKEGSGLLLPLRAQGRDGRALLHSFTPRQMRSKIPAPGHTCCASSLPSCCCCYPNRSLQVVSGAPQVSGAASAAHSHQAMGFPPRAANTSWCKEGSPVPRAATSTGEHPCVGCQTPGHPACTRARDCTYKDMSWPPKGLAGGICVPCCHPDVFGFSQQQFPSLGDCK